MTIGKLQTGLEGYNSGAAYQNNQKNEFARTEQKNSSNTDSVVISKEAQTMLDDENSDVLPVEAYALPSWFEDYTLPSMKVGKIDHEFWNLAAKLTQDDKLTAGEKQQIKSYLQNDPEHQERIANQRFITQYQAQIETYQESLKSH